MFLFKFVGIYRLEKPNIVFSRFGWIG